MGSSRSDGPSTPSGTSSDTCAVPCPSPAEPDLQPGGLREQDLVLPGYLGRRQDRDPPGHPEQTPALNEQGRQCRTCPGEAHNPHISFSSHVRVTVVAAQIVCGVQFIDFGFVQPRVALAFSGALSCHLDFYNARSCSRLSVALRSNQLLLHLSAWPIEQVHVQITAAP